MSMGSGRVRPGDIFEGNEHGVNLAGGRQRKGGRRGMNKSMKVWIYACQFAEDPAYRGGVLSLPAHQEAKRDAFQRLSLIHI